MCSSRSVPLRARRWGHIALRVCVCLCVRRGERVSACAAGDWKPSLSCDNVNIKLCCSCLHPLTNTTFTFTSMQFRLKDTYWAPLGLDIIEHFSIQLSLTVRGYLGEKLAWTQQHEPFWRLTLALNAVSTHLNNLKFEHIGQSLEFWRSLL